MIRKTPYTLLEMVGAVAILLTVLGISAVGIMAIDFRPSPAEEMNRLRRLGALARRQAAGQRQIVEVVYSPDNRRITGAGEEIRLPETFLLCSADRELQEETAILRFFPDGSAAEQRLTLTDGENQVELRASPLTGILTVHEKE